MKNLAVTTFLAMTFFFGLACSNASVNKKSDLVVETTSSMHGLAGSDSQDILLHSDEAGSTYLYVEQRQGPLMTIFDVTDPAHITLAASVPMEVRGAFDFIAPVNSKYELISYRDGSGTAMIDLHKAKAPRMVVTGGTADAPTMMLGTSGYLASTPQIRTVASTPQNIEVVETVDTPHLLITVANVVRQVTRLETGTTFLLNNEGITVVRRTDAEKQYVLDRELKSHN
jgi:hypothetical protein